MMALKMLMLDLFFNQKIKLSQLLDLEFDLVFNVNSNGSTPTQRQQIIQQLLDDGLLAYFDDEYLQFTKKGGEYWEELFKPTWSLYHEMYSLIDEDGEEFTYFYACDLALIEFFVANRRYLLGNPKIKVAKNWQPIYWKEEFQGYYIKIEGDDTYLSRVYDLMPNYKGIDNNLLNFNDYLKILLMDKIAQYPVNVNHFIYANKIDNYKSHEFQAYDLATMSKLIFELLQDGFCEVFYWKNDKKVIINKQALEYYHKHHCFDFDREHYIALSQKGVAYWQEYFKPNWDYYIGYMYDDNHYTNPVAVEVTSINEALLEQIFQHIDKNKIQKELLNEWEICYWKTIRNQPIFKYSHTANSIAEKILVDDLWRNLSDCYRDKFCPKSQDFY